MKKSKYKIPCYNHHWLWLARYPVSVGVVYGPPDASTIIWLAVAAQPFCPGDTTLPGVPLFAVDWLNKKIRSGWLTKTKPQSGAD